MKITGNGTIESMMSNDDDKGSVDVSIEFKVQASDVPKPAKMCGASVLLTVQGLAAEQLKWGQRLYLTISTEPPKDA